MEDIVTCETCGLLQRLGPLPLSARAMCARCGFEVRQRKPDSGSRTLALALGALILYFPANIFPIIESDYWGMHRKTTILDGIDTLFQHGSYFIGGLVLATSVLTPAVKIIGLLALSITLSWPGWEKFRTWTFKLIQILDPWNMLEVMLLSIVVSIAELGKVATVYPGSGVFSFGAMVVLMICATLTFDSRLIWDAAGKEKDERPTPTFAFD
jgi:paraquat-inducible protein A